MVHYAHIWWGITSMIELVRDLRVINALAKFENYPWKIMDLRVLMGLVCPAGHSPARPPGRWQYPGALKGCGVTRYLQSSMARIIRWKHILLCSWHGTSWWPRSANTLRPRQNCRHFVTTISIVFSWKKIFEFRLRFHWILFPRVQLTIFQHWFR